MNDAPGWKNRLYAYFSDERGNSTLDYIVLCAGMVALAISVSFAIRSSTAMTVASITASTQAVSASPQFAADGGPASGGGGQGAATGSPVSGGGGSGGTGNGTSPMGSATLGDGSCVDNCASGGGGS